MAEKYTDLGDGVTVLNAGGVVVDKGGPNAKKTEVKEEKFDVHSTKYTVWGDNNRYPQEYLSEIQKSTLIPRLLDTRANLHFAEGIYPYRLRTTDQGKFYKEFVQDPRIRRFWRLNRMNIQMSRLITDYEYWGMGVVELILSNDRNVVNRVFHHDMSKVRFAHVNRDTGKCEYAFIASEWNHPGSSNEAKLPLLDPDYALEQMAEQQDEYKFLYPVVKYTPGRDYYAEQPWQTAIKAGWHKVAKKVPEIKEHIFNNQMSLKYHVTIHENYWHQKFSNWPDMSAAQKKEAKEREMKAINDHLVGLENSGKSIFSGKATDRSGNEIQSLDIKVLEDQYKDGSYLPDASAANMEIAFSAGVDPSLIGLGIPGGSDLNGSGSDKRESKGVHQAQLPRDRAHVLDVCYFLSDVNGWDPDFSIEWTMMDKQLTTLDQNPTGSQNEA
jgi:hypothetical protein